MKYAKSLFIFAITIGLFTGCVHYQPIRATCKGSFVAGDYTEPSGAFSVSIPKIIHPINIREFCPTPDSYSVSFDDYRGSCAKIDVLEVWEELIDFDIQGQSLALFFVECVYPDLQNKIPGIAVEGCNLIETSDESPAYFALFNLPQGSNIIHCDTNTRRDTLIGFLLFVQEGRLVLVLIQFSPTLVESKVSYGEYATASDYYQEMLLKIKRSFHLREKTNDACYNSCP